MYGSARQGGQRSLARSAPVEVAEQLTHALAQISTLPGIPALRREGIKLQVALINSLMHVKGYAAPETKEQASLLIEQAEASGEALEDRCYLFSVLYGFWAVGNRKFIECHYYKLPIPADMLERLENETVETKVTLAYFTESNLGFSANVDPQRYQSFGLRFDLQRRNESVPRFKRRVNPSSAKILSGARRRAGTASGCWAKTAFRRAPCTVMYGQDLHHPRLYVVIQDTGVKTAAL